jgi:L-ascorbate metabolism protein UlaG (beta-lactamase superfamily)
MYAAPRKKRRLLLFHGGLSDRRATFLSLEIGQEAKACGGSSWSASRHSRSREDRVKPLSATTLIVASLLAACSSSRNQFSEEQWHAEVAEIDTAKLYAPHFMNGEYFNPWLPMTDKNMLSVFEWKFSKRENTYTDEEKQFMPRVVPDPLGRIKALGGGDFILWVGHNTFLMRINGDWWITDPIFSDRALLPKRKTPPGMSLDDLAKAAPKLNVVISHNHYDHLDEASIKKLPAATRIYSPLGLKKYFEKLGRKGAVELDWWQEIDCGNGARLVCLPAQHWSKRISQPFNSTLWASFMLVTPKITVYMGGDSGYFPGYREIGKKFPRIDYALIPTTAFHPRWFMHYAHINVTEALMAFRELGARNFIPTQWGTFQLGDEPPGYPAVELKRKIRESGIDPGRFLVMDIGGIVPLSDRGTAP